MRDALPTVLDRFERPLVVTIHGRADDDLPKLEWFGLHCRSRESASGAL
jgi:hypothetical protein